MQQLLNNSKKLVTLLVIILCFSFNGATQDYGGDKVSIANYVKRMYDRQSFSGVKILQNEEGKNFIISVVELKKDPNKSESVSNQIAVIKAKGYVSQFLNGSVMNTQVDIITTQEQIADTSSQVPKTIYLEKISETSSGFASGIELLTKFNTEPGNNLVYVFYKEMKK
jgi:beta-xylosidase